MATIFGSAIVGILIGILLTLLVLAGDKSIVERMVEERVREREDNAQIFLKAHSKFIFEWIQYAIEKNDLHMNFLLNKYVEAVDEYTKEKER